ncbi:MAG: BamA/TamA family outer membrane protein [Bacteroidales bacterium]|nr:BamA/TamA family outer membrane protein [Bacteroidales bacterium]
MPVIDYKKSQDYIIKDVQVSGIKYLDKNIIISLSGLNIGREITVPGDNITDAIQKLWDQGLFTDVKVSVTEIVGDSINLAIFLQERHRLSDLEIFGLNKGKVNDIKEDLELKRGMQVTENLVNNTERVIKEYMYNKKYLNAKIDIVQINDTLVGLNSIKLNIYIDKGEKIKIKEIDFEGNTVFKMGKLRRVMKKTKKKNLNIFAPSKFMEDLYAEDKVNIIKKYNSLGYRDVEILSDSIYTISNKRIGIKINITEGNQYFLRDINWVGNTRYKSELLDLALKINKGEPYDPELITERLNYDEDAVSNLYLDYGYLFFNVSPVISNIENDSVDIQMRIFEGERVRLNKININGNTKTNEHVIRRELKTRPGDLFSKSDIVRSQRELAQLGFFDPEQFGIEPVNVNQAESLVDLDYTMVEKSTDMLEISGGWGANMFVGTLGVRFSNFSAENMFKKGAWRPIPSGDGQTLSLRAQTNGKYYSTYSVSFVEPWMGGKKPNSFSVTAYYSVQKRTDIFYQVGEEYMKVIGISIGLGQRLKQPDDYFTLSNSINYQRYDLNDWAGFIVNDGAANNFSISTTFARSSVDAPIYPRAGSSFALTIQLTPPYSLFKEDNFWQLTADEKAIAEQDVINSVDQVVWEAADDQDKVDYINAEIYDRENAVKYKWAEYHKWKFNGKWFLKIWDDMVLAANTEFGYLGYYNKDIGYTPFGRFDLGGDGLSGYSLYGVETIGLRGYENGSITPKDTRGSDAGNIYEKINFELRYPISLKPQAVVYVLGFVEAGNAWTDFNNFNPFRIKRSAGIGVRAFLPMFGLLGVDWGYGFDEIANQPNAHGSQFHFVIGQQF